MRTLYVYLLFKFIRIVYSNYCCKQTARGRWRWRGKGSGLQGARPVVAAVVSVTGRYSSAWTHLFVCTPIDYRNY